MIPRSKLFYYFVLSFEFTEQNIFLKDNQVIEVKLPLHLKASNMLHTQFYLETMLNLGWLNSKKSKIFLKLSSLNFNFLDLILCCLMKQNFGMFFNTWPTTKSSFLFSSFLLKKLGFLQFHVELRIPCFIIPCFNHPFKLKMYY